MRPEAGRLVEREPVRGAYASNPPRHKRYTLGMTRQQDLYRMLVEWATAHGDRNDRERW